MVVHSRTGRRFRAFGVALRVSRKKMLPRLVCSAARGRAAVVQRARSVAPRVFLSTQAAAAPHYGHVVSDELIDTNGGLLEYSVVYTDRALNHMSTTFQQVVNELHDSLCSCYGTDNMALIPGSGTYAMEAAARAFSK